MKTPKPAYPMPAYKASGSLTHGKEPGINSFQLVCLTIATGVIERSKSNATIQERATQIVDQAVCIMDEIESRGLDT